MLEKLAAWKSLRASETSVAATLRTMLRSAVVMPDWAAAALSSASVRTAEQDLRHPDAHLPTTGERADIAGDLVGVQTETLQYFLGAGLQLVSSEVLVVVLRFAEASEDAIQVIDLVRIREVVL